MTYEGENNVLIQQTGKYLIDHLQKKLAGKPISSPLNTVQFLNDLESFQTAKCSATSEQDFYNPSVYLHAFQVRVACLLLASGMKLQEEVAKNQDLFFAWNQSQVFHVHSTAKAYIELLCLQISIERIQQIQVIFSSSYISTQNHHQDQSIKSVLLNLCHLFALSRMEADLGTFRENDYLNCQQTKWIRNAILHLCDILKKEMVSLVDAVAPPDQILGSALGYSDGYVYKHLWNAAITSKAAFERPSWWHHIKAGSIPGSRKS